MVDERDNQAVSEDSIIPEEISEVLKDVAPEKRKILEQIMISQISMIGRVSPEANVTKQVTGEHITQMLKTQDKVIDNEFKDGHERRLFSLGIIIVACAVLVVIILLLKDQPDMMEKIITIVFSAILGAAGGYGVGFFRGKKDE